MLETTGYKKFVMNTLMENYSMIAIIIGYVVITIILTNSVSNAFKNVYDNTIISKRFAWFPTKVETWRETTAIIWLQTHSVKPLALAMRI